MSNPDRPRPIIFGCASTKLSAGERSFFADINPLGFILFQRNCQSRDQIKQLTAEMRETVGRPDAPILIDQEGGRVSRLKPPVWPKYPAAGVFGDIWKNDPELATEAMKIHATLMGHELAKMGVTVDCAPLLDLTFPVTHDAIGDRAFSDKIDAVTALGRAFTAGLLEVGVLPVIKHMPGHGRATVDPHLALPVVDATEAELEETDIKPFIALRDMPIGMTCHVLFKGIDPAKPTSMSEKVIKFIREKIRFEGLLFSDDLDMHALKGRLEDRARDALQAGTDVLLYCQGGMPGMIEIGRSLPRMTDIAWARWEHASKRLLRKPGFVDEHGLASRLDMILGGTALAI